jgi:uncharacterized membrane protein (UPF0182 family)
MFTALALVWILLFAIPLIRTLRGISKDQVARPTTAMIRSFAILGGGIVLLVVINVLFGIFTEYFWYESLDFASRYATEIWTKIGLFLGAFVVAFLFLGWNYNHGLRSVEPQANRIVPIGGAFILAVIMGSWAAGFWEELLLFLNQSQSSVTEPIFNRPANYYLFSLSLYQAVVGWLIFLIVVAAIGAFVAASAGLSQRAREGEFQDQLLRHAPLRRQLTGLLAVFFLVLAWNAYLGIYELMFSTQGVVTGAGWADVNVRQYAYYVTVGIYLAVAAGALASLFRPGFGRTLLGIRRSETGAIAPTKRTVWVPGVVVVVLFSANSLVPAAFSNFVVEPNQITLESEFIEHNIEFTRQGFNIDDDSVDSRRFEVGRNISRSVVEENEATLDNIRLWDPGALLDNLQQQQEIRLYYEFHDVDIDRYDIDGEETQVMLSVREMEKSQLDPSSQTWVSRHLKFTHGYGLVFLPVHEFLPQGGPNLLIRNIPPESSIDLEVTRPEIYYGERTNDHVYVKTQEEEFNYPSGDENVYTEYQGDGGVDIGSPLRRFMYAWKYDGHQQLFSGYFDSDSRIMFDRNIVDRARKLAPFLTFDRDPYPVITEDGHVKYIIDAYTTARNYPYSERYQGDVREFNGTNYLRNSVKAVVDAYDGTVEFYVVDDDDVIINTYQSVFPGLFKPFDAMPDHLQEHIRYPVDYMTVQAEMYSTYHMEDVQTFYQREDVWQFATERYRDNFQSVDPYYVMLELPDSEEPEFVSMMPFTPKNKNVINAWMAGRSDMPNYGELTVFTFPKGVEVLGPRQIEARIDQDAEMSQRLSLWGQRGSDVIRGNLLTIPLFGEQELYMLFVEPIFLQAEGASLPEIKRVAMADQDRVVWGERFETALERVVGQRVADVFGDGQAAPQAAAAGQTPQGVAGPVMSEELRSLIDEAVGAFDSYKQNLGSNNFSDAGSSLEELNTLLQEIEEETAGAESTGAAGASN